MQTGNAKNGKKTVLRRFLPFEKVNARGEKRQGAVSLTKGWCAFSLTNKSRAFSLTRETQIGIKFMVWSITVGR